MIGHISANQIYYMNTEKHDHEKCCNAITIHLHSTIYVVDRHFMGKNILLSSYVNVHNYLLQKYLFRKKRHKIYDSHTQNNTYIPLVYSRFADKTWTLMKNVEGAFFYYNISLRNANTTTLRQFKISKTFKDHTNHVIIIYLPSNSTNSMTEHN